MEIVSDMQVIDMQLEEAKKTLKESKQMVQKMQDIVFCMEAEVIQLKEEIDLKQNKIKSEIYE
tara:strand:+ start:351 stop:539 length:189 start_codon:yes stop_codon:yes gene_type:complete